MPSGISLRFVVFEKEQALITQHTNNIAEPIIPPAMRGGKLT